MEHQVYLSIIYVQSILKNKIFDILLSAYVNAPEKGPYNTYNAFNFFTKPKMNLKKNLSSIYSSLKHYLTT